MAGDSPDFGILDSSASIVRMVPAPASGVLALTGLLALRRRR